MVETAKYLVAVPLGGVAGYLLVTRGGERAVVETFLGSLVLAAAITIFALVIGAVRGAPVSLNFFQRGVLFWSAAALAAWAAGHGVARERWSLTLLGIAAGNIVAVGVLRLLYRRKSSAA